jgi:hypothetical protein
MSSPIQTAKDKDRDSLLMYAPSWAREKRSVVAAHESTIKQPAQGRTIDAAGTFDPLVIQQWPHEAVVIGVENDAGRGWRLSRPTRLRVARW